MPQSVKGNPIELLKAIKQHALNYNENRYEMSIILDSMRALFNLKQKDGESFQDYTKRFKTARDVLRSHIGGPIILTKFIQTMDDYDAKDTYRRLKYAQKKHLVNFLLSHIWKIVIRENMVH